MGKMYRSKVDWWLGLILAVAVVAMVSAGTSLLATEARWVSLFTFFMAAFTAWLPFSTCYTITDTDLLVRSAFFRWRVPLEQITEVHPTHNPLSSPALSLDRFRVSYKRPNGWSWGIMISPKEKEQFLSDLAQAAGLEREENRLVRKG